MIEPETRIFLLTGTLRMGTVKKTSLPFKAIEANNFFEELFQLIYDGVDIFTGSVTEFY